MDLFSGTKTFTYSPNKINISHCNGMSTFLNNFQNVSYYISLVVYVKQFNFAAVICLRKAITLKTVIVPLSQSTDCYYRIPQNYRVIFA